MNTLNSFRWWRIWTGFCACVRARLRTNILCFVFFFIHILINSNNVPIQMRRQENTQRIGKGAKEKQRKHNTMSQRAYSTLRFDSNHKIMNVGLLIINGCSLKMVGCVRQLVKNLWRKISWKKANPTRKVLDTVRFEIFLWLESTVGIGKENTEKMIRISSNWHRLRHICDNKILCGWKTDSTSAYTKTFARYLPLSRCNTIFASIHLNRRTKNRRIFSISLLHRCEMRNIQIACSKQDIDSVRLRSKADRKL